MASIVRIGFPLGIALALVGLLLGWSGYLSMTYANALQFLGFVIVAGSYGVWMLQTRRS
jgi:hypothetical protein